MIGEKVYFDSYFPALGGFCTYTMKWESDKAAYSRDI